MIDVVWLNYNEDVPARGYWDMGMIEDVFANKMWETNYKFEHHDVKEMPDVEGAVIVFAARNQVEHLDRLNKDIKKLKWVILMLTGDEEAVFPVEKVKHPNIKIWVMSPRPDRHEAYDKLGTGYPVHMHDSMEKVAVDKDLDLFFGGQITHERREAMANVIKEMEIHAEDTGLKIEYEFSEGFTQGLEPKDYFRHLARAKVAPAPSGPETPDSFRLFEALEAACVPIADTRVGKGDFPDNYWTFFFGEEPPFPVTTEWDWLQGWTQDQVSLYPSKNNWIFVWWQQYKRKMALKIRHQIEELSGIGPELTIGQQITVLVSSSPIKTHPSTDIIEETIRNVRVQLPDSPIYIMLDGVREEQKDMKGNYEEYQRRLLWLCNHAWDNVLPVRYETFGHQSTMTRKTLPLVETPYILFVEHDAPLVPDFPIEWGDLTEAIKSGEANVIRFHHESMIHPEHKHMMHSGVEKIAGAPLMKTSQWSQRPHLASTAFYRNIMEKYFTDNSRAFIEHGVYGPIVEAYNMEGIYGWNLWKLWLYYPDTPDNIQRSYTTNGRGDGLNFESTF